MSTERFQETPITYRTGDKAREHLEECGRHNGDGNSTGQRIVEIDGEDQPLLAFCSCPLCDGARWIRNQVALGLLSGEQADGARSVMRALGGEP